MRVNSGVEEELLAGLPDNLLILPVANYPISLDPNKSQRLRLVGSVFRFYFDKNCRGIATYLLPADLDLIGNCSCHLSKIAAQIVEFSRAQAFDCRFVNGDGKGVAEFSFTHVFIKHTHCIAGRPCVCLIGSLCKKPTK